MKKWHSFLFIFLLAPLLALGSAFSQRLFDIEWEVAESPETGWTIGDQISLKLNVTAPGDISIGLPELPSEWGPFEVINQEQMQSVENDDGTITVINEATVIPWETGDLVPPAITIQYQDSEGNIEEEIVPVLSIQVNSVLSEGDTQKHDLKPQATLSLPGPAIWPWILGAIGLGVLLVGALWWIIRRRRKLDVDQSDTNIPVDDRYPEEIAYEKLEQVEKLNLPATGEFKQHYDMVTDCVRTYLEGIYQIPAMERTTGEIMTSIRKLNDRKSQEIATSLRSLLEEADLVKFAKFYPTVNSAGSATAEARRIVDVTKPDRNTVDELPERIR